MTTITGSHRRFPITASACLGVMTWALAATAGLLHGGRARAEEDIGPEAPTPHVAQSPFPEATPVGSISIAREDIATAFRDSANTRRSSPLWTFGTLTALVTAGWVARRVIRQRRATIGSRRDSPLVDVLGMIRIDEQLTVHVLRIGSRVLAVGMSPVGLATLTVFDDAAAVMDRRPSPQRSADPAIAARDELLPLFPGNRPIGHTFDLSDEKSPQEVSPHRRDRNHPAQLLQAMQ